MGGPASAFGRWRPTASACAEPTVRERLITRPCPWSATPTPCPSPARVYTEKGGPPPSSPCWRRSTSGARCPILAHQNFALAILRRHGAHYLFTVKGNAPETFQTLETIDWDRDASSHFCENDEKAWPHREAPDSVPATPSRSDQLPRGPTSFPRHPKRDQVKTGEKSIEVAYGMTTLPPEQADAEQRWRSTAAIGSSSRTIAPDTTFGEDACLMHTGHGPSNNALATTRRSPHLPSRLHAESKPRFALPWTRPKRSGGRRARLSSLPEPSPIETLPTVPRTLGSSGWVPAVADQGPNCSLPAGLDSKSMAPTPDHSLPRPRILENLSPVPSGEQTRANPNVDGPRIRTSLHRARTALLSASHTPGCSHRCAWFNGGRRRDRCSRDFHHGLQLFPSAWTHICRCRPADRVFLSHMT